MARKSSIARHIPYRGDQVEVGKKTGVAVTRINPGSDGFEPFEDVIAQAPENERKKRKKTVVVDDDDDNEEDVYGEQDMSVDSPIRYVANAVVNSTPTRFAARPVSRTSEVDFDAIPSPPHRHSPDFETSFTDLNRDDDGDDDQLPVEDPGEPDEQQPVEELMQPVDESDREAESQKKKSPRKSPQKPPKKRRKQKENQIHIDEDPPGVRRSKRRRYEPLDWWRCEKVVYGHPRGGQVLIPHITEIVRIPMEPLPPLGSKHRRKNRSTRSRSKTVEIPSSNPEEGWDDDTEGIGIVNDYKTKEDKEMCLAVTATKIKPRPAVNDEWSFHKLFSEDDFVAAGQLHIPPHGRKPSKPTKDNCYMFFVAEGAINLKINDSSFILCSGSQFCIPRGNQYYLENISERTAKLFFTQARRVVESEDTRGSSVASSSAKKTPGRSESVRDGET